MLAQIFVEPESYEGRQLHLRYRSEGIAALPPEALKQEIAALASAYQRRVTDAALIALAREAIATLPATPLRSRRRPTRGSRLQLN